MAGLFLVLGCLGLLGLLVAKTGLQCAEASTKQHLEIMGEQSSLRWVAKTLLAPLLLTTKVTMELRHAMPCCRVYENI